ncbi:MAG TPA: hypothetical protein V6C95_03265, partial [Coleofasciculaceae cyanobacterium]
MSEYPSVCWMTQAPIRQGDRVASLIVELRPMGVYYDAKPDSLYRPVGIFGRGEYSGFGWLSPDPDQPEFELLILSLLGVKPESPSHEIDDRLKALTGTTYKRLGSEKTWGKLTVCLVLETALDRAISQCTFNDIKKPLEAYRSAYNNYLQARQQPDYDWHGDFRDWQDSEELLYEALLGGLDHPSLAAGEILLQHSPRPNEALPYTEEALCDLSANWAQKFAEIGAFYRYHALYLWRPVCHTGFAHIHVLDQAFIERAWIVGLTQSVLDEIDESQEYFVPCTINIDGERFEVTVNALPWIMAQPADKPEFDPYDPKDESIRREWEEKTRTQATSRMKQVLANQHDAEIARSILCSDYANINPELQFARQYVERFNPP